MLNSHVVSVENKAHEHFMRLAFEQALIAKQKGEVPVGAVLVQDNEVIASGHNLSITQNDPSLHAEVVAIREACKEKNNYRLPDSQLYVTLEPCTMCAGLMIHTRIHTLIFAAKDPKTGAAGSIMNVLAHEKLNHKVQVISGVLEQQCSEMLSGFFKERRAQKKLLKQNQN